METAVRTYDLYNTTFYWLGYNIPDFVVEQSVAQAHYYVYSSSNIIGSQIDFFSALGGRNYSTNNVFSLTATLQDLPYLWKRYWWDEAMYYSHPLALSAIKITIPGTYQDFSESVGTLYYLSRFNNLENDETTLYSTILGPLLPPGISGAISSFYSSANTLFKANLANIGPTADTLVMADTDLTRRITSNLGLTATVNSLYKPLSSFLPYNTEVIGNLLTPYYWSVSANCEDTIINVSVSNSTTSTLKKQLTETLIAT